MPRSLVILAAGLGSRFGGSKQTAAVGPAGEWLLDFSILDAVRAGFDDVVLVIRPGTADAFSLVADRWRRRVAIRFAEQRLDDLPAWFTATGRSKPWGTGHAVLAARQSVSGAFAAINADDFYGRDAFRRAAEAVELAREQGTAAVVGMRLDATLSPHGAVSRAVCEERDGHVVRLTELQDIARDGAGRLSGRAGAERVPLTGGEIVSMNFWVFPPGIFEALAREFDAFLRRSGPLPAAEFLLPEVVNALIARGDLGVGLATAPGPWFGLTHASDRALTEAGLRALVEAADYPSPAWRVP